MKTLYLYLTRQVVLALFMTMGVFLFVMLLGEGMRDVMGLLVSRKVALMDVLKAVGLLIPFLLAYALPMGLLTATLLVFGRFSADQELTAARSNGISLISLVAPILLLGVLCSGLSAWINLDLAPRARVAFKQHVFDLGVKSPEEFLTSGALLEEGGAQGVWVYIGKRNGQQLEKILVSRMKDGEVVERTNAERGTVRFDEETQRLALNLEGAVRVQKFKDDWYPFAAEEISVNFDLESVYRQLREPKASEMTFAQLQIKILELELKGVENMPEKVHLNRQVSGSFACIGFVLIGIPLGLRAHRRETIAGVAIAVLLVCVYYGLAVFAQSLENRADMRPDLLIWAPNALFQIVGAALLWRANRG